MHGACIIVMIHQEISYIVSLSKHNYTQNLCVSVHKPDWVLVAKLNQCLVLLMLGSHGNIRVTPPGSGVVITCNPHGYHTSTVQFYDVITVIQLSQRMLTNACLVHKVVYICQLLKSLTSE